MRGWLQRWLGIDVLAATVTALHDRVSRLESARGLGPGDVRDMHRRLDAVVEGCGGVAGLQRDVKNLQGRVEFLEVAIGPPDDDCGT